MIHLSSEHLVQFDFIYRTVSRSQNVAVHAASRVQSSRCRVTQYRGWHLHRYSRQSLQRNFFPTRTPVCVLQIMRLLSCIILTWGLQWWGRIPARSCWRRRYSSLRQCRPLWWSTWDSAGAGNWHLEAGSNFKFQIGSCTAITWSHYPARQRDWYQDLEAGCFPGVWTWRKNFCFSQCCYVSYGCSIRCICPDGTLLTWLC